LEHAIEPFGVSFPTAAGRKSCFANLSLREVRSPPARQGHNPRFRNSAALSRLLAHTGMAVGYFTSMLPQVCRGIFAGLRAAAAQCAGLQTLLTRGK